MKTCTHCGHLKPYSEFHKDRSKKDGYRFWCKKYAYEPVKKRWEYIKNIINKYK